MKRLILGVLLASVVWFVYAAAYWMNPLATAIFKMPTDDGSFAAMLGEHLGESGVYVVPSDMSDVDAFTERHRQGPLATVFFHREGAEPMSPGMFIGGFLHMLVSVILLALLLRRVLPAAPTYGGRLGFFLVGGLAAAVISNLGRPIWMIQTWDYHIFNAIYDFTSWVLVGAILAKFITPEDAASAG